MKAKTPRTHPKKRLLATRKKPASSRAKTFGSQAKKGEEACVQEEQADYFCGAREPFRFLEFFAGGGMARAGLAPSWASVWANDFSESKAFIYRKNWGSGELRLGDVGLVDAAELPSAHMAWGSFPCQDLSQAGNRSGIGTEHDVNFTRSGSFWPFWKLIARKKPPLVVLENVEGALKANGGADLRALCTALSSAKYRFGPIVLDAVNWVPQSRRRLFIVAVSDHIAIPPHLLSDGSNDFCHPGAVLEAFAGLAPDIRRNWLWWSLPLPRERIPRVETLINTQADQWVDWDDPEKTKYILSLMNERHTQKVAYAQQMSRRVVGFAYRRTRHGAQRAEVRFDGIAGCLRTAGGGSSKQIVVEVNGPKVRTRLLSPREAARLQGLPDSYWLPADYNDAYDLVGDGLSVPVVKFLGRELLTPLALSIPDRLQAIA